MSILVLGALHLDVVVDAERLPRLGETLMGDAVDYRFGGKGGNQAVAAARLGAPVSMAGRIGQDHFGTEVESALDRANVDRSRVKTCDAPTGMSVAITEAQGDYGAVVVSGANLMNDGCVELPADLSVAILQNEIPEDANTKFVESLPSSVKLIHNAAPARPGTELPRRPDVLIVNQLEAGDLTGTQDPMKAAIALEEQAGSIVLTLGGDGLILVSEGVRTHVPAFKANVISTHGAGDVFTGALAAALWRGADIANAAGYAQAAASVFISTPIDARHTLSNATVRTRMAQSAIR